MHKFMTILTMLLTLGLSCQPAAATDYVTDAELNAQTSILYNSLNAQIADGFDSLNYQLSEGLSVFSVAFDQKLRSARNEVDDQASLSLALSAAPDPMPMHGDLGLSVGVGYLHGRSTALAMKFGERDWQLGAAINRRAFALSAGLRL